MVYMVQIIFYSGLLYQKSGVSVNGLATQEGNCVSIGICNSVSLSQHWIT